MQRLPVTSSNIKAMGYADGRLEVEFTNGRVYAYTDVPEGTYRLLGSAPSVGKAFATLIRGKYMAYEISVNPTLRIALAFMMQNDLRWLQLHLPVYISSGVFDGMVALDGGSQDAGVFYVESLGGKVSHRPFDHDFGTQGNALIAACEADGYDALLRIDPDELLFPQDCRKVRTALEAFPDRLIGLQRRHFVGDRLHVHRDWNYDPQWRAWHLHRGVHYPAGQRVHEVPSWNDGEQLLLEDVYIHHYGYLKSADEIDFRTATYAALQSGVELPKREDYVGRTLNIPSILFEGAQPLDPKIVGIHAPFEGVTFDA